MLNQCKEHSDEFGKYAKPCIPLTTYASLSRYPSNVEITEEQMKQALRDVGNIIDFMTPLFTEMGYAFKTKEIQKDKPLAWLERAKEESAEYNSSLSKKSKGKDVER